MDPAPKPNVQPAVGCPLSTLTLCLVSKNIVNNENENVSNKLSTIGSPVPLQIGSSTREEDRNWYSAPEKKPYNNRRVAVGKS